jgi:transposase
MGFLQGEGRNQGTLFPVTLNELIPDDHMCRVIDAFVSTLDMATMGFERAEPAETGRPGYDPRDLLRLYLYGYLQQVRSSRRLEVECHRNIELMWLLGKLSPDYKTIAEFRRVHCTAIKQAGAQLVKLARSVGLIRGEWIAIDGSKFRSVSSSNIIKERDALQRYLEQMEGADNEEELVIENSAVADALKKLREHPEPETRYMKTTTGLLPCYNVQTAVDSQHALIVAEQVTTEVTDRRSLQPMAEAARAAVGNPDQINVVADVGYSNGEQAEACEAQGIIPHVPAARGLNTHGDGTFFDRTAFPYQEATDTLICPAGKTLARRQVRPHERSVVYASSRKDCKVCPLKSRCTTSTHRLVQRHMHDGALQRMQQRATPEVMRLRRSTVEHPFGTLKYRIFGHPRFLLRGVRGAQTEISLAVMAYNLKRMVNILGGCKLSLAFTNA